MPSCGTGSTGGAGQQPRQPVTPGRRCQEPLGARRPTAILRWRSKHVSGLGTRSTGSSSPASRPQGLSPLSRAPKKATLLRRLSRSRLDRPATFGRDVVAFVAAYDGTLADSQLIAC
jgi:hypothetical protein